MHVVAIVSRKGGSGKTTLAGHLAVQAERVGDGPVAVVDTDPQGSLAGWWNARSAPQPGFVQTSLARLDRDLERLESQGTGLVFIDTPSGLGPDIDTVVQAADLVVIPTRPSPHDLRSLTATVELVEHLGTPLVFVVNAAVARARITSETVALISRYGPMAPSVLGQRVDFAASMIDGRTVMEVPGNSRSADEIRDLWSYLIDRLEGGLRSRALPRFPAPPSAAEVFADGARIA